MHKLRCGDLPGEHRGIFLHELCGGDVFDHEWRVGVVELRELRGGDLLRLDGGNGPHPLRELRHRNLCVNFRDFNLHELPTRRVCGSGG